MTVFTKAFATAAAQARPPQWQRSHLLAWKKRQGEERMASDNALLELLFNAAQKSPVAQAALIWARTHAVEFIIDHSVTFNGYYARNTGVVALSLRCFATPDKLDSAVNTLVHEIRHAWQDHHGFFTIGQRTLDLDIAQSLIENALLEADAYAHGRLAQAQYQNQGDEAPIAFLQKYFDEWYCGERAGFYGQIEKESQAVSLRIAAQGAAAKADASCEFGNLAFVGGRLSKGLNHCAFSDVYKLGQSFAGCNYLTRGQRDRFLRFYLSSSHAMGGFKPDQLIDPLIHKIRALQLRERLTPVVGGMTQREKNTLLRNLAKRRLPG